MSEVRMELGEALVSGEDFTRARTNCAYTVSVRERIS
jgi:hypothetical protein